MQIQCLWRLTPDLDIPFGAIGLFDSSFIQLIGNLDEQIPTQEIKNVQEVIQAESTPMQSHNVTIQPRGFFKLILTRV